MIMTKMNGIMHSREKRQRTRWKISWAPDPKRFREAVLPFIFLLPAAVVMMLLLSSE